MSTSTKKDVRSAILVTGGEGLIGRSLVEKLSHRYDICSLDLAQPREPSKSYEFIHCDLTKDESVTSALKNVRKRSGTHLASVIHLAAYYDFSGDPSPMYRDLTVEGTRRLLRGLQNFSVDQFVFSSTLLVMKPAEKGKLIREVSPVHAGWDYPESKLQAERVIAEERGDIPSVILRIAGVYDDMCHSLPIAQQISRIYERNLESYVFPGDASKGQSFIHLDDLTECLRHTVERRRELAEQEVFLIGEPDIMTYQQLQDQLGENIHGKEWPTLRLPKSIAKAGALLKGKLADDDEEEFIKPWMIDFADENYPISIQRARDRLEWEPKRRLRDTLPKMVRALLDDPIRWYEANKLPAPDD